MWLLQATYDVAATNNDVEGLKVPKCHTPSQTHANVFLRTSPSPTIVTTALIIDAGVCQRSLACTTARAISSHDQGASSPTSFFSITHHGFTSFNTLDSCFLPSTLQPESSVTCVYFHFILCPLPLPPSPLPPAPKRNRCPHQPFTSFSQRLHSITGNFFTKHSSLDQNPLLNPKPFHALNIPNLFIHNPSTLHANSPKHSNSHSPVAVIRKRCRGSCRHYPATATPNS